MHTGCRVPTHGFTHVISNQQSYYFSQALTIFLRTWWGESMASHPKTLSLISKFSTKGLGDFSIGVRWSEGDIYKTYCIWEWRENIPIQI